MFRRTLFIAAVLLLVATEQAEARKCLFFFCEQRHQRVVRRHQTQEQQKAAADRECRKIRAVARRMTSEAYIESLEKVSPERKRQIESCMRDASP